MFYSILLSLWMAAVIKSFSFTHYTYRYLYSLGVYCWMAGNNSRRRRRCRSQVHAIHSTRRKGKWPAFLLIAALVNFQQRVREKVNTFSVSHIRGWMNREAAHFSQQQRQERMKEAEGYMSLCPLLRLCLLTYSPNNTEIGEWLSRGYFVYCANVRDNNINKSQLNMTITYQITHQASPQEQQTDDEGMRATGFSQGHWVGLTEEQWTTKNKKLIEQLACSIESQLNDPSRTLWVGSDISQHNSIRWTKLPKLSHFP